jgi:L-lactate dehydrogenase
MNTGAHPTRVAVVGVGNVGATYAYSLMLNRLSAEIVLIDGKRDKAEGEAMDLNHAVPFAHATRIWAGDFADCAGAAITVIAAGANQRPGETRMDIASRNAEVWRQIIPRIVEHNPEGILLVATNPVDVLTYVALKLSGFPPERVIGSGTILDTARFRHLLSRHFHVDSRSVHGFIIGEHGDSEVPVWSLANIAGMRLEDYCRVHGIELDSASRQRIYEDTRDAAYHIIERKGATFYGVAAGLVRITAAVLRNQNTVFTVSTLIQDYYGIGDVCLSLPAVLSSRGVDRVLQIELDKQELTGLLRSSEVLKSTLASIGL